MAERAQMQQFGLGGILRQFRLRVPPNQREYSWTDREVTTLLQDLARAIAESDEDYFLGTVVTIARNPDLLEVVDGQQRLATTAILLAEIRNYLRDIKEEVLAESVGGFLADIDRERRERVVKLQLNLDDNEFFRSMINAASKSEWPEPTKPSHHLIRDAFVQVAKQIKRVVSPLNPKDQGDALNTWISFVEHGAQVVLVKVPTDGNAYKMFETLNDRGLKTSQSDLVKNYLFGQSDARLDEAQQKWALMRGTLESLDEDDITITFLRHALIASRGYLREPEVYETVQGQARGSQAAVAFLGTLETLSTSYVAMFNPAHEKWNPYPDAIRKAIATLNLLNIKPMRPLMLAIAARFSEREASEAFRKLIAWGVRFLVAGITRSGSVEQPMAAAAKKVYAGEIVDVRGLKAEVSNAIPNDEQFRQLFEIATVSKTALARYYLRSLEMEAKQIAAPWFVVNDDRETINLEHVLPMQPKENWPQFDAATAKAVVKRLGNQALIQATSNSDLSSSDFETKKAAYRTSPYELTSQIAGVADWTPETIAARQKTLAALALRTWPL